MMNIVEKLGGYENAKKLRGTTSNALLDMKTWEVHVDDIDSALLKYRREHNIFEVGDRVLTDDEFINVDGSLYQDSCRVDEVLSIESVSRHGFSLCGGILADTVRHATELEIEAGYRL